MHIYVTEDVACPCDTCDYAPSLCDEDVENCLAGGRPRTTDEQYLKDCHNEEHWIYNEEEKQMRQREGGRP